MRFCNLVKIILTETPCIPYRVSLKERSNNESILLVLLHPQLKGLQAPVDEVAIKRAWDGSNRVLEEADLLVQGIIVESHGAHDHIGVSVHVLGNGVVGDVGAKLQGAL